jgi:hypothetical protein
MGMGIGMGIADAKRLQPSYRFLISPIFSSFR